MRQTQLLLHALYTDSAGTKHLQPPSRLQPLEKNMQHVRTNSRLLSFKPMDVDSTFPSEKFLQSQPILMTCLSPWPHKSRLGFCSLDKISFSASLIHLPYWRDLSSSQFHQQSPHWRELVVSKRSHQHIVNISQAKTRCKTHALTIHLVKSSTMTHPHKSPSKTHHILVSIQV